MLDTLTVEVGEARFIVSIEFTKGEIGGWDSPPVPDSLDILGIRLSGSNVELIDLLKPCVVDDIRAALDRPKRVREQIATLDLMLAAARGIKA